MARRRKTTKTATRRRASYSPRRRASRSRSRGGKIKALQFDAMIYGGLRQKVSNMLEPLTKNIPFGSVADEIGMGLADYLVARNSSGQIRDVALTGLTVENARLGEAIANGEIGFGRTNSVSNDTLYG